MCGPNGTQEVSTANPHFLAQNARYTVLGLKLEDVFLKTNQRLAK